MSNRETIRGTITVIDPKGWPRVAVTTEAGVVVHVRALKGAELGASVTFSAVCCGKAYPELGVAACFYKARLVG